MEDRGAAEEAVRMQKPRMLRKYSFGRGSRGASPSWEKKGGEQYL